MQVIHGYKLIGELKTTNSGFSKWGFAEKGGIEFFIKELIDPVYPIETKLLDPVMLEHKRKICQEFENRNQLLYRAINKCSDGNLVRIESFFRSGSHYYLVMEKVNGVKFGEVQTISFQDKARICKALIHSLHVLHQQGIVHADIKMDNILFRRLPSGSITGKIIDFDNSFWERQPPSPEEEIRGDPVYMAPETFKMMQNEEGYIDRAIDVFALGLVIHQILDGKLPEFDRNRYDYPFEAVLDHAELICSRSVPEEWRQIIIGMIQAERSDRLSLEDANRFWRSGREPSELIWSGNWKKTEEKAEAASVKQSFLSPAGDL